jgi:hypothetical protein
MMAGRIAYGLFPGVAILLAVGTALGQGIADLYERASGAAALPDRCCRMAQHVKRELSL